MQRTKKLGKNFFLRAYIIQEYYKLKRLEGLSNRAIYRRVRLLYLISEGTFYNYLSVPARARIKELNLIEEATSILRVHLKLLKEIDKLIKEDSNVESSI